MEDQKLYKWRAFSTKAPAAIKSLRRISLVLGSVAIVMAGSMATSHAAESGAGKTKPTRYDAGGAAPCVYQIDVYGWSQSSGKASSGVEHMWSDLSRQMAADGGDLVSSWVLPPYSPNVPWSAEDIARYQPFRPGWDPSSDYLQHTRFLFAFDPDYCNP
ncbi:hypothetical protein [Streptomyces sp. NPDC055109]